MFLLGERLAIGALKNEKVVSLSTGGILNSPVRTSTPRLRCSASFTAISKSTPSSFQCILAKSITLPSGMRREVSVWKAILGGSFAFGSILRISMWRLGLEKFQGLRTHPQSSPFTCIRKSLG